MKVWVVLVDEIYDDDYEIYVDTTLDSIWSDEEKAKERVRILCSKRSTNFYPSGNISISAEITLIVGDFERVTYHIQEKVVDSSPINKKEEKL